MSSVINPNQKGQTGETGAQGAKGDTGNTGATGATGAAATVAVGSVTTGAPGSGATVINVGTSSAAVFDFSIPRGDQGATGATGSAGDQGPAGFGTVTPSTPARTIGAAFQPNATKAVLASYSCVTQVTNPLLEGNSSAMVRLLSDASNPPTIERCRVAALSSVALTVGVQITTSNTAPLAYIVPAGHYVLLSSTTSGTASVSIAAQTEEVLG
jgi:hypothetical protein